MEDVAFEIVCSLNSLVQRNNLLVHVEQLCVLVECCLQSLLVDNGSQEVSGIVIRLPASESRVQGIVIQCFSSDDRLASREFAAGVVDCMKHTLEYGANPMLFRNISVACANPLYGPVYRDISVHDDSQNKRSIVLYILPGNPKVGMYIVE